MKYFQVQNFGVCMKRFGFCIMLMWVVGGTGVLGSPWLYAEPDDTAETKTQRDEKLEFFEQHVRPVLVDNCFSCHSDEKQEAGLRVDSLEALLAGGDSGPAILLAHPDDSILVKAIEHRDSLEMPPGKHLNEIEIAALRKWIEDGSVWPKSTTPVDRPSISELAKDHWAFLPMASVDPPANSVDPWVRSPIDAFVLAKLQANGMQPMEQASRATLIRRVSYTLTGLPPTDSQVEAFTRDSAPDAYQKLVDRLLALPQYGEHWARHWLDVARYSDTKGYVYDREERFWTHAWSYRDWVVNAINSDVAYNRFLLLQIAADQVPDATTGDLAAMGFLTLGRRFLGVRRDIIDDQIDVVTRGTLGLTVGCARCHDHKFDPIPTADYYSLYGVFESSVEEQVLLSKEPISDNTRDDFAAELNARQTKLRERLAAAVEESVQRIRNNIGRYLFAQTQLERYPADGFDQIFGKDDLLPVVVRNWSKFLAAANERSDSVFSLWHACSRLPAENFAELAGNEIQKYRASPHANPWIVQAFDSPVSTFREMCDRYGAIFESVDAQCRAQDTPVVGENEVDIHTAALKKILYDHSLYGVLGPCQIPEGPISHSDLYFDTNTLTELWKLQGEVDRWLNQGPEKSVAVVLRDRATAVEPQIFLRGNPLKLGSYVTRHFLSALDSENHTFKNGSGRLELANAIIDPHNPLTARVFVNRVWMHHFGTGLVRTPSDFGLRAEAPSHPELLDWLANEFIRSGWSLKRLHRLILLSSTFRQSSLPLRDSTQLNLMMQLDPENRLLWRMNPRRLTFEELRDSMLQVSGELDLRSGGRPANLFAQPFATRRTLYGTVDRQYFSGTLRVFDFANPDLHIPQRNETTVPQQALFFLNSPMVLERARALAALSRSEDLEQGIHQLYRRVFQRSPTAEELTLGREFLNSAVTIEGDKPSILAKDWSYGYGEFREADHQVKGFSTLPYFSGDAWQGSTNYPDEKLGWVQLTSTGGHPGNSRVSAAVRRWTAPADMTVTLSTQWHHQPDTGDGVRVFVVSSERGILKRDKIHHSSTELNVEALQVKEGETIDFVVDIDEVLDSDQFLCEITIEERLPDSDQDGSGRIWNARSQFPDAKVKELDGWEQLAHALICTNEFLFVD